MAEDYIREEGNSQERGGFARRYTPKPRFCQFCSEKTLEISYCVPDNLKIFVQRASQTAIPLHMGIP